MEDNATVDSGSVDSGSNDLSLEEIAGQIMQENEGGAPAPKPSEPKPEEDAAQRFARIARREKELRRQKQALKAEQAEVNAAKELRQVAKTNPKKLLETYGLSVDDVLMAAADITPPEPEPEDPIAVLKREIEELKTAKRLEAEEKHAAEVKAKQSQLDAFKSSIRQMVDENEERYELIKMQDQSELVWDVIEAQYQRDQTVLTAEQAADKVEAYLLEQASKLTAAKKLQPKPKPTSEEPTLEELYAQTVRNYPNPKAPNKTLSNDMHRMPAVSQRQAPVELDDDEAAFQAAVRMLKFN